MEKKIGEKDLETITRWMAQEMKLRAENAVQSALDSNTAYNRAKRKERDWRSGIFRAGLGAGLVVIAVLEDTVFLALPLGLIGGWLMVGGGLATSGEYNDTIERQGPLLARFLAVVIGAFRLKGKENGRLL